MRRLDRRTFLQSGFLVAGALIAAGHTPYKQWVVYRKAHLLILSHKADRATFDLGKRVAGLLLEKLPDSRAQVSLAPGLDRVASLLNTRQIEVAILSPTDAALLASGSAPEVSVGPVPMAALFDFGTHAMVCHRDFRPEHGYLVAQVLRDNYAKFALSEAQLDPGIAGVPLHVGAAALAAGEEPPAATAVTE